MENKNKSLKISARFFGILNALILLILYLMLFPFSEHFDQILINSLGNNLEAILYITYFFLLISIISALLVKHRPKQEKHNVFFAYLTLTSINFFVIMFHIGLSAFTPVYG